MSIDPRVLDAGAFYVFTLTLKDKSDAFEVKSSVIIGTLAIKFPTLKLEVEDGNEMNPTCMSRKQSQNFNILCVVSPN